MENELLFSDHYKKKHEFNLKLKPTPIMTEYHPSTITTTTTLPTHNKHELITDLTNDSNDKFNLSSSSSVSQNTHNVVVKARKLLPILDDTSSNKTGYDHLMHFTTYKSASILNFAPNHQQQPKKILTTNGNKNQSNNNFDTSSPAVSRTLPKMTLVRNASQHNFTTNSLNGMTNQNSSTQLPAIKTNVSVPLILNTQTFASAPNKTTNFTAEPSKLRVSLSLHFPKI